MRLKKKTYNQALIEDLHEQNDYLQEQIKTLREEVHREKIRNEAITANFERMAGELEDKNKIIAGLSSEVLRLKEGKE